MGADLYIKSINNRTKVENEKTFQQAVVNRDSLILERKNYVKGSPAHDELTREIDKIQKLVSKAYSDMYSEEGYFRDSYNSTSVLWTLGLSWWKDLPAFLDEDGFLKGEKLKAFYKIIKEKKQNLPTRQELEESHCTVDDNENSVEVWHKYYIDKRKSFLKFMERAMELEEGIYCSV